jgi:diguanylate cyclase (GGDEF)-like protein
MASPSDSDLRRVVDLFFERRLRELEAALDRRQAEVEDDAARQGSSGGPLTTRGLLVSAWADSLHGHCRRALTDLGGLLRMFGVLDTGGWVWGPFEMHVDRSVAEVLRRLSHSRGGGPSSFASERNRIANLASRIRADGRQSLSAEVDRARRQQEGEQEPERSSAALDDRLPLHRRGVFDQDLVEMVKRVTIVEEPLSLVMLDIDHFKSVNDQHGHPVGDEVLLEVAERAMRGLGRKGRAYRYGGEEFALLLPNFSTDEALGLAERIRKDIERVTFTSKSLKLTASFGVAGVPEHAADGKAMLERADAALYRAKEQGRNRVVAFSDKGPAEPEAGSDS